VPEPRPRRQPQRSCVACRTTTDKRGLTRIVRTAEGHASLDPTGRLPGRGAYLCSRRACWERALGDRGPLARALRVSTVHSDDRSALLASAPPPGADEGGTA
jgi:predicted RNA-binding protein YlxR (DUF448 family)